MSHHCQNPNGKAEAKKKYFQNYTIKINEISALLLSIRMRETEQSRKMANMNSRVSTGWALHHIYSISSWITYDFSAICRQSLEIPCIKKKSYCSESLHLSALLSPLLLLVDFLWCGRVFCHKPGSEEVHPEQVHSTSWSLTITQRLRPINLKSGHKKKKKTKHYL